MAARAPPQHGNSRLSAELDFFLYLDHADANEAFGRVILEAAASGVLTIVHPKHRSTFGDTVDYALPGQAQALIGRYAADSVAYQERVERTLAEVRRRYGRAGFADRLASLTEPERSDSVAGGVRPGRIWVDPRSPSR
ncbi:glycosyltransferase [Ornithinimicrobium sp. INDO-MA30-4]|uniref:glycosyltransferase n=1 Tax=Ornithinimicrobium sp. INDO-MA30-4 TaxID=2908651 RepID=UPI001F1FCF2B|nr:glycosyltransferase [Ornithinimicrobium sp. INDO-MA30-4]UJH70090.1 glycosyltransferase [Ornithinimicrobium sp. INDO-MA30-4]